MRLGLMIVVILMHLNCAFIHAESPSDSAQSMAGFCKKYPRTEYASLKRIAYDSNWFELYEVAKGVTAIYEPHQWQEVVSYLIEGNDSAILFDTGNGIGDIKAVVDKLTDKPVQVLNSHGHFDHVGGNYAFSSVIAMDTDFSKGRQKGQPNKVISLEVSKDALCRVAPKGVTEANHIGRPYSVSQFIHDGHTIELGDRTLEVLLVPGHTPDAIALIDRQAGLMWTGDSYYSGPIWLYAPETDLMLYRKSLERLIAESEGIKALLPAHNTPWVNPDVLVDTLKGFDLMLLGKAKKVGQGDGTVEYVVEGEQRFSFLMRDEPLPYRSK